MAMTARELRDLLTAAIETGLVDPDEELSGGRGRRSAPRGGIEWAQVSRQVDLLWEEMP